MFHFPKHELTWDALARKHLQSRDGGKLVADEQSVQSNLFQEIAEGTEKNMVS